MLSFSRLCNAQAMDSNDKRSTMVTFSKWTVTQSAAIRTVTMTANRHNVLWISKLLSLLETEWPSLLSCATRLTYKHRHSEGPASQEQSVRTAEGAIDQTGTCLASTDHVEAIQPTILTFQH
ncbi:hypothetical protein [Absidia glauca]|uniref:Uncharacterized protein n=1 Tax=Absidia glauca TaxID=4829 RepID=A0A168P288_ABSGL|nr:hypothetical protein [Absidia glauca]